MIKWWLLALWQVVMAFEPSNEWQVVPEGESIPKGLEVKMDLESGQRLARFADKQAPGPAPVALAKSTPNSEVGRPILDLEQLEELAHDFDHGQQFMEQYGAHLIEEYESGLGKRDHAGKVLGVAVRNNPNAASALLSQDPELALRLAQNFQARDIYILANLATAQYDQVKPALVKAQSQLSSKPLSRDISKQVVRLVRDIGHTDKPAIEDWAGAIQQALQRTGDDMDGVRLDLLRVLTEIVEKKGEFEGTNTEVSRDFVSWLADQAVRASSSSGVKGRSDNENNPTYEFLQLVKQVRHRVYGNPKAARLHMDL